MRLTRIETDGSWTNIAEIVAPLSFNATIAIQHGKVVKAPATLEWMVGMTEAQVQYECEKRNWRYSNQISLAYMAETLADIERQEKLQPKLSDKSGQA